MNRYTFRVRYSSGSAREETFVAPSEEVARGDLPRVGVAEAELVRVEPVDPEPEQQAERG